MTLTSRISGVAENTGIKAPCRVATTANITLSGLQSIDGVTTVANDRVLVKNQTNSVENGIYAASSGNWLRATDFDGANDIVNGTTVFVASGAANASFLFAVSASDPITIGSSAITFVTTASFGQDLQVVQTGSALTLAADENYNAIRVTSDASAGGSSFETHALNVELVTGQSTATGQKIAIRALVTLSGGTTATGHDLIGVDASAITNQPNGGTNTGAGAAGTLYGGGFAGHAFSGAINYFVVAGAEFDAIVDSGATTKHRWAMSVVGNGAVRGAVSDAAIEIGATSTSASHTYGIFLDTFHGAAPLPTNGTVIGTDGSSVTVANFADLSSYTFTGNIFNFTNYVVTGAGNITGKTVATSASNIQTGPTYTVATTDSVIVANVGGTQTLTLPAPASFPGRWLTIKTVTANTVVSASSNVVPLIGGAAGTAILAGTAGKWAQLQSTGGAWEIMASN